MRLMMLHPTSTAKVTNLGSLRLWLIQAHHFFQAPLPLRGMIKKVCTFCYVCNISLFYSCLHEQEK